jgi:hypothetical protein
MCTETSFVFERRGVRDVNDPKVIRPIANDPDISFNPATVSANPDAVPHIVDPYACRPTNDENFCWLAY